MCCALQKEQDTLDGKLEQRRKQFHVLVTSIHQLQQLLDDDAGAEEASPTDTPMEES